MRRCGHHIDGRPRGEALPPQDSGVEVVDAISAVPSFLVRAEGPTAASESGTVLRHRGFGRGWGVRLGFAGMACIVLYPNAPSVGRGVGHKVMGCVMCYVLYFVLCVVLYCVALRCGVLYCVVLCCVVLCLCLCLCLCGVWCVVVWCGVVWCGVVWCGVVWCGVVWCGVVWCGVVWCGVVWCGVVWPSETT